MLRDTSRRLTVVLLLGALILVVVAFRMRPSRTVVPRPVGYHALAAPFAAGSISGRVMVASSAARPVLSMPSLPPGCESRVLAWTTSGGLADTVVALVNVHAGLAPRIAGPTVSLDRCGFSPRVSVALEGATATVNVTRGDHRVQASLGEVRVFDAAATGNSRIALVGDGLWTVRCATSHPWEQAWIWVSSNPYATVTDASGRFHLDDVPAGDWVMKVWNPSLGERTTEVLVEANRDAVTTVRFQQGD